jgi:hypothetical protein
MASYRVTAPYVVLAIKGVGGVEQVRGFYKEAIVTDPVQGKSLTKHIDRGWVERLAAAPAEKVPAPAGQGQDGGEVPTGAAEEVLAWVGDDADRARRALAAEQGATKPRSTLVDKLGKLAGQSEQK